MFHRVDIYPERTLRENISLYEIKNLRQFTEANINRQR